VAGNDRQIALQQAAAYTAAIQAPDWPPDPLHHATLVTQIADVFWQWLTTAVYLELTVAAVTASQHGGASSPTVYNGGTHMATLTDTQQVSLSVAEADAAGQPVTSDTLVWTVDNPAVITLTVSADTYSAEAVAGTPGDAVITVTDSSNTALTGTAALTVVSGAATTLLITEGDPVDVPPAV